MAESSGHVPALTEKRLPGDLVGELGLYRPPWLGNSFGDPPWSELFQWAAQNGQWLTIHPRTEQIPALEAILAANPETKVLVHTAWQSREIPRLLETYENLHFTLDLATLISIEFAGGAVDVLMSPVSGGRADFIRRFDAEVEAILLDSYERSAAIVLAAPDGVMWGTDVFEPWHLEPEVYDRLIGFARRWVAMLPAEVREGYAYRNADRLLGPAPVF